MAKSRSRIDKSLKPASGLDASVRRIRRQIAKEIERQATNRSVQERSVARDLLNSLDRRAEDRQYLNTATWVSSLLAAAVSQVDVVAKSKGIVVPFITANDRNMDRIVAFTDFKSVKIQWPLNVLATQAERQRFSEACSLKIFASAKGVAYHELGHIEWTLPFSDLLDSIGGVLPDDITKSQAFRYWNALEDQRMEAAVIRSAPIIKSYFTHMVAQFLLLRLPNQGARGASDPSVYTLLSGRQYLPAELRQVYRDRFDAATGLADAYDEIVARYMGATSAEEMMAAVVDAARLLRGVGVPEGTDGHDPESGHGTEPGSDQSGRSPQNSATQNDGDSDADGDADGDGDGDGDADGDADADGDSDVDGDSDADGDGDSDSDVDGSNSVGQHQGNAARRSLKDMLSDASEEALESIKQHDDGLSKALAIANERKHTNSLPSLGSDSGKEMGEGMVSQATLISYGIETALSDFVTTASPVWRNHADEGVLVPIDFRTRSVGDTDYWSTLEGNISLGLDLHVSFLSDVSVSMHAHQMLELSQAMYSTALACERLGITSDFVLWSSGADYWRVWENGITPTVWPSMGGTDPIPALDSVCDNAPQGGRHLVVIFTDGAWGGGIRLTDWNAPNRTIALLEVGYGGQGQQYAPDAYFNIRSIDEIPARFTEMVADVLRQGK